ncbi:unnamed protein product [Rhizoctonia solani]|uniref:Uncharacterized protein n=1 Tax=Rhizoctonia solani TaxID=456999 RepID=A0A8H3BQU4_9AGAM|nr:unnamed protein product [Rhizoctonia solani]
MSQNALSSTRPVVIGDTLSFDTHPDKDEDLMECTVKWKQDGKERSAKYMVFKAKNVTAGDTDPCVPVFVQTSYYNKTFENSNGVTEFMITSQWHYGQRDETGADRFVVLHDEENQPYQHRFIASWLINLENLVHDAASAAGYAFYADKLDELGKAYLGDYLHSYSSLVVQSGDVLLVPSKLKFFSFGNLKTIKWMQRGSERSAEYYSFSVVNATQKGQDVMFFIQKEWWQSDSTSENHISKIATKNADGQYEFKIDAKSQYGQADKTGKNRWVVYHDKERHPYQHRFVKSILHSQADSLAQAQAMAGVFGIKVIDVNLKEILDFAGGIFGDSLHTFN